MTGCPRAFNGGVEIGAFVNVNGNVIVVTKIVNTRFCRIKGQNVYVTVALEKALKGVFVKNITRWVVKVAVILVYAGVNRYRYGVKTVRNVIAF